MKEPPSIKSKYNGNHYDLLVIGAGPAGQRAAIQAAKIHKRVAVVDDRKSVGGVCVHTGTIPSKAFREAVLYLSGYHQRNIYGAGYRVKSTITMDDLNARSRFIMEAEIETINSAFSRNHIEVINGRASFVDAHSVQIETATGTLKKLADKFVIAVGARPAHPERVVIDGKKILDSDNLLGITEIPETMVIIGGGVIGIEYGSMFAALGCAVTLVDGRTRLLDFVDHEIVDCLIFRMRSMGVTLRLGEVVSTCSMRNDGQVVTHLESGKVLISDCVLFAAGRESATDGLGLEKLGMVIGPRGKIAVNEYYQTSIPHIYAVGDVIGFPALASTSGEQGRLAARHAFGLPAETSNIPLPFGIYSIPEIAMVGKGENELTAQKIPYEVGIASYNETTKGHLVGDRDGMLKLIFDRETRKVLGVHIIGEDATELIHIGQMVIGFEGTLEFLMRAVFNYPSLSSCYKIAALNGYNKLREQI